MSEPERVTFLLRGIAIMAGTIALVCAVYFAVDKYRSRVPELRLIDIVLSAASKLAIVVMIAYVMAESPWPIRTALPLVFVLFLELSPQRWRQGFWNDLSLRIIAVVACCFTISEILFAWWR